MLQFRRSLGKLWFKAFVTSQQPQSLRRPESRVRMLYVYDRQTSKWLNFLSQNVGSPERSAVPRNILPKWADWTSPFTGYHAYCVYWRPWVHAIIRRDSFLIEVFHCPSLSQQAVTVYMISNYNHDHFLPHSLNFVTLSHFIRRYSIFFL